MTDASVGYLMVEIEERCREAIIAGELLDEWVAADADSSKVWVALRSILNAAANISLRVCGPGGAKASDRLAIRSFLGITKRSPIHNSMLRHDSEHVDDRIFRAHHTSDSDSGIGYAVQVTLAPRQHPMPSDAARLLS